MSRRPPTLSCAARSACSSAPSLDVGTSLRVRRERQLDLVGKGGGGGGQRSTQRSSGLRCTARRAGRARPAGGRQAPRHAVTRECVELDDAQRVLLRARRLALGFAIDQPRAGGTQRELRRPPLLAALWVALQPHGGVRRELAEPQRTHGRGHGLGLVVVVAASGGGSECRRGRSEPVSAPRAWWRARRPIAGPRPGATSPRGRT